MQIGAQDFKHIINTDYTIGIDTGHGNSIYANLCNGKRIFLGGYSSNDKAEKVIANIQLAMMHKDDCFCMPADAMMDAYVWKEANR